MTDHPGRSPRKLGGQSMLELPSETTMQTEKLYKVAIAACAIAGVLRLLLAFVHFGSTEPDDHFFDFTVAGIFIGLAFFFHYLRRSYLRR
jgi:hypothetical protein